MHRGLVLIYNIHKLDFPFCRFDVCRASIQLIREVVVHKLYLFFDDSFTMTLAQFTEKGLQVKHRLNTFRNLFQVLVFNSSIFLAYQQGDIDFFEVQDVEKLLARKVILRRGSTLQNLNKSQLHVIRKDQVRSNTHVLVRYDTGKENDSNEQMTAIAIANNSGLIASADRNNLIKIWTD